jgi:hypothetical protein
MLLFATPAWAHAVGGQAAGFLSGVPVTFPMVMAFGGFLGLVGIPLPGVEAGIALSAVLLGLAVAREARPPLWLAAALVGFFAIFLATRTAPSCRRGRAASFAAADSSSRRAVSTPWVSASASSTGGAVGASRFASAAWRPSRSGCRHRLELSRRLRSSCWAS